MATPFALGRALQRPTAPNTQATTQPFGFGAAPTKSVQPVGQTGTPYQAPAAPRQVGASWDQLSNGTQNPFATYRDAAGFFAKDLGYSGNIWDPATEAERSRLQSEAANAPPQHDAYVPEWQETAPAAKFDAGFNDFIKSKGYQFAPSMQGKEPATSVYDSTGKQVGQYRTGSADSPMMKFMSKAMPLVVGGVMGAGALGAMGGGAAGGAGAGVGEGMSLTGAGAMDAYGAMDAAYGAAGWGGAEAGAYAGGAGMGALPEGFSYAANGMEIPGLAGEAGYGMGTDLGYSVGAGGGSGWGSTLGSLGTAASQFLTDNPWAGSLVKGAAGTLGAGLASRALTGSPPTGPSASSLISQQSGANTDAALLQAQLNRVDTTTPFGSQKFGRVADPSAPGGYRYTQDISFSPTQQKLYDAETSNQIASQGIAGNMQGRVADSVANPLDLSSAGAAEKAMSGDAFSQDRDKVTSALFDRLTRLRKPQMDRDRSALDVQLRNQGLMPGTEAYDNGMKSMLDSQNTEMSDAADRALLAGGTEQSRLQADSRANAGLNNQVRSQAVQETLLKRQQPLAEFNSFRTGNTPTLPTFQPFGMGSVSPVNTTAAAQTQYQSQADAYNAKIAQMQSLLNFGTSIAKGG